MTNNRSIDLNNQSHIVDFVFQPIKDSRDTAEIIEEDQIISTTQRSPKELRILDCALKLLIETGDAGLTLRKLAESADMRLSNVQYYFRSRDDLLAAMVARYFSECTAQMVQLMRQSQARTLRDRVYFFIRAGLVHGDELSDMCRAFREIWAISSRNDVIDQCLMGYYRSVADVLAEFVIGGETGTKSADRLMTLLVPYFEGYSITARSLPLDAGAAATMLTELALSVLDADA
ncbi:TetR/AcrR family transcriptional regulator [Roseibium sp. RKSG952]|uniref:TetR/AcrR family transcriptional regulator n=1 Tax=Roseibium sp. RKSG952 TaxID=2529384 RepID=UPI0018AD2234|nr:TetR/AcrR family transcriptional regulator [Roseibium sp. RKSG952]